MNMHLVIFEAFKLVLLFVFQLQDEFQRITMVNLEPKFMSKLDEYTPRLMTLFNSKGGAMGLRLKALLLQVIFSEY